MNENNRESLAREIRTFVRWLENLLKRTRLDQERFGELVPVKRVAVARWLAGQTLPSRAHRRRLQEIFEATERSLTPEDILRLDNRTFKRQPHRSTAARAISAANIREYNRDAKRRQRVRDRAAKVLRAERKVEQMTRELVPS